MSPIRAGDEVQCPHCHARTARLGALVGLHLYGRNTCPGAYQRPASSGKPSSVVPATCLGCLRPARVDEWLIRDAATGETWHADCTGELFATGQATIPGLAR